MVHLRNIPERVKRWIPPFVAAAAAVVVFLPVLTFGFLEYDDLIYVFGSPLSAALTFVSLADAFLSPYFRSYSPLTLLTHAIDLRVWGESGGMHHLLNLLLHAANVLLVYRIGLELFRGPAHRHVSVSPVLAALCSALMFAVHPLHVEPVAWISGRKDLLMAFFLLASFLLYVRWREGEGRSEGESKGISERNGEREGVGGGPGTIRSRGQSKGREWGWRAASTAALFLALLSKSTAAAFPLVLVVCDRLVLGRRESWEVLLREKAVMVVMAAAGVLVAALAGRGHDTSDLLTMYPPAARVLLPIFTPAYYLWQLVWPFGLTPFTPAPSLLWLFIGAGGTVVVTASLFRWRRSGLLAAWLAFLALLVPTIGGTFMETGMQPWADRFTYVPMIPIFLVGGLGTAKLLWPPARIAVVIVLTLGFAAVSRAQLEHWRSTEAVWTRVVRASPALAKGYKNLGSVRSSQGRHEEAVQLFRQAVALKPGYVEAHNDLGIALVAAGRPGEALEAHRTAIALDSTRAEGYNGYGIALLQTGDVARAYDVFRRGIEAQPGAAKLRFNAGSAALALGDTLAAVARFQETVSLEPGATRAAEKAAQLLDARGDPAAGAWYERAAAAGSAEARAWLARRGDQQAQGAR